MNKDVPWRQLKGGGGRESPMLFEELGIRERDYQKIGEHLDLDRKRLDYDTFYTFYQDFVVNAVNTAPDGWTRYVAGGVSSPVSSAHGGVPTGMWQCSPGEGGTASVYHGLSAGDYSPLRTQFNPVVVFRYAQRTNGTTAAIHYIWLGIGDAASFIQNADTDFSSFIGFRFTVQGAAITLVAVTRTGGAETITTLTDNAITVFDTYRIEVTQATSVKFFINGHLVATHTANIPSLGTQLTPGLRNRCNAGGNGGVATLLDTAYGWSLRIATQT